MIRRPPRSTRTDTLSLHDALPISGHRQGAAPLAFEAAPAHEHLPRNVDAEIQRDRRAGLALLGAVRIRRPHDDAVAHLGHVKLDDRWRKPHGDAYLRRRSAERRVGKEGVRTWKYRD